jgi:hypothetical protein
VLLTLQPAAGSVSRKKPTIQAADRETFVDVIRGKNRTIGGKQQAANRLPAVHWGFADHHPRP